MTSTPDQIARIKSLEVKEKAGTLNPDEKTELADLRDNA